MKKVLTLTLILSSIVGIAQNSNTLPEIFAAKDGQVFMTKECIDVVRPYLHSGITIPEDAELVTPHVYTLSKTMSVNEIVQKYNVHYVCTSDIVSLYKSYQNGVFDNVILSTTMANVVFVNVDGKQYLIAMFYYREKSHWTIAITSVEKVQGYEAGVKIITL